MSPITNDATITVSTLNRMAKSILEGNFPSILVEGEISNFVRPASGHWYFTLKDRSAQVRCAMFAGRNRSVKFRPENGNQILLKGKLSIYEGRGDFQLIVDGIEEAGDGALRRAFEELKARLDEEGLFQARHKKTLSSSNGHLGVITSSTGAAFQDVLSVLQRRFPAMKITLIPVAVQGKTAPGEIVEALKLANRCGEKLGIDALILGRGGGSLEDLQAFNDERVARAVFASELPVVSAVGHEIDFTICDFVADLRAPTPSAAAELLSPDQEELLLQIAGTDAQLLSLMRQKINHSSQQLLFLKNRIKHPRRSLEEQAQTLDRLESRAQRALHNSLQRRQTNVVTLAQKLRSASPRQRLDSLRSQNLQLGHRLQRSQLSRLKEKSAVLAELSRGLNSVSPLSTLARGYSISYKDNDQVIRSAGELKKGDSIRSQFNEGAVVSVVQRVED